MRNALRHNWPMLLLWLFMAVLMIWFCRDRIITRAGWDPDDQLRMVQLRDFLGGQSWFDTTQYRMNAPFGAPMHWSRLIELPLALLVLVFTPLVGAASAEMVAGTMVPLLCLGGIAYLLAGVGAKIGGRAVGLVAFALTLVAPALLIQLRPMRIDHHGWQIFCAVLGFATLYWTSARKAGLVLGAVLAVWSHISLEGAPMTAAFFLYLGWRWTVGCDNGTRLFWTLASFASGSVLLFIGTQPNGFSAAQHCDTISATHIWAILVATAIVMPATYRTPQHIAARAIVTIVAGLAAVATLLWFLPHCAKDAFGDLDPVVRSYWYNNVLEGLPLWHQDVHAAITLITPLVAAILTLAWIGRTSSAQKWPHFHAVAFFLCYATLLSILVFRTVSVATAFTIVPIAYGLVEAFRAYRVEPRLLVRLSLVPVVIALLTSGILANALYSSIAEPQPTAHAAKSSAAQDAQAEACSSIQSIQALAALPRSTVVAPFNIGPAILLTSRHTVLASSHHRNRAGMRDQIDLFRLPPPMAKRIIERRAVHYLAVCPLDGEMTRYKKRNPSGLWAQLAAGSTPTWLEYRGTVGKGLMVWRVR